MINSVWVGDAQIPNFPCLTHDLNTDVLIIGGGLAGLLCAHKLAADGVDYALIESDKICHGVTRNTTAKITSQHGYIFEKLVREFGTELAHLYWDANEMAVKQYFTLAKTMNCDFELKDNFIYSVNSAAKLEKELNALEQIRIPAEFVQELPLPFPVAGAICVRKQAQFNPLKFASEISKGLNIYENTRACTFEGNTVITNRGKITASKIIVATHFPILNKHGSYFLKMYQQRSYVLALNHAQDVNGMYLDAEPNGLSFRNDGKTLLVGGGGHRTGKQGGGWAELVSFTKRYYPDAVETCRWATQDCMTLDGIPYIGQYSKQTPDLYVSTGFNKWGITSSMVSAMVLSDLVQGKENPYTAVFSPSRTVLRPQLLTNIFESTVNLLTPTKPRCPHLGCALKWNAPEHSWDCPCHGSRFTDTGKLLDNPATDELKRIDDQ